MGRDQGQATPLLAAGVGLVAVMLLALGPVGSLLSGRAQARTAADAAALAGAAEGEEEARTVAEANSGALVAYETDEDEVVVAVDVAGVRAWSRARRVVTAVPYGAPGDPGAAGSASPGTGDRAGLAPAMLAALANADRLLGRPVPLTSGYRSPERQRQLWERRHSNPYPVAPPGSSLHERGLAVDVPSAFVDDLLGIAGQVGLCQTLPVTDPIHFEVCGAR